MINTFQPPDFDIESLPRYTVDAHYASDSSRSSNPPQAETARVVVQDFLTEVRSGRAPERAGLYMANTVLAHQLHAEQPVTIERTPAQYADHVRAFSRMFGAFEFEVTELIADGDRVYVRWWQRGWHKAEIDGYAPTGKPLIEIASVVYRVAGGKIVEYWLQTDRQGFELQLKQAVQ